jgi:hypothetical protein
MANSGFVSRSQLLLQYLLAMDMTLGTDGVVKHSPDGLEVRDTTGDLE